MGRLAALAASLLLVSGCASVAPPATPTATPAPIPTPATPTPPPAGHDPYEPNDTPETAYGPLLAEQTYSAFVLHELDDDYYWFDVEGASLVRIELEGIPAAADYDLWLYDEAVEILNDSSSQEMHEAIQQELTEAGRYYIHVEPFIGFSAEQPYRLRFSLEPIVPAEDTYEPNETREIAFGPIVFGEVYRSYLASPDDMDIYRVEITTPGQITIELSEIPVGVDYDLYLLDAEGVEIDYSVGLEGTERIQRRLEVPGIYFITVQSYAGSSVSHPYALRVTFE